MKNRLRQLWKDGGAAVNGWLAIPSAFSAEIMAQCGWDSVTVDTQHGVQDYMSMVACFQAMQAHPVTPLVRVPWYEPGIIGKSLDGGAHGIICPMINTAEEAEALVQACRYPPRGKRSNGPVRMVTPGAPSDYQQTANDEILVFPMIETQQALDNLEAILDVKGIDGIYVGPSDLAFSLGMVPRLDHEDAKILAIYERLIRETTRRGLIPGLHNGTAGYAARMIRLGFRLVTVSNDGGLMALAARAAVTEVRKAAPGV